MAKVNPDQGTVVQVANHTKQIAGINSAVATAKSNITTLQANEVTTQSNPGHAGAITTGYATFGGATDGTTLKANVNTAVGYINDVADDLSNIKDRYNQLLDLLAAAGVLT
jgi:hypothetical protein